MKNKTNKKNVLHVISTLKHGGTERYLINLIKGTSNNYNNVVLFYYGENTWLDELSSNSTKVYKIENRKIMKNIYRILEIRRIIKQEKIDIVYSYTYYNSVFVLLAACLAGVKKRIVHAHRIGWDIKVSKVKVFFSRLLISMLATDKLACSDIAGRSLFNGKYKVVKNGFFVDSYRYNTKTRQKLRKQLNIDDGCMLLGGIGRIDRNKNQRFMIKILKDLLRRKIDSKLLLIGGPYNEEYEVLKEICKQEKLNDYVIFIDEIDNVNDYYSVIDVLLVTSFKESFSFVMMEGQANGVPILASETISSKIVYNKNIRTIRLWEGANVWADAAMDLYKKRTIPSSQLLEYSVDSMTKTVVGIYEQSFPVHKRLRVVE